MKPILVAGFGRSGTTALMSLLATAPRIAFDRVHPFEHRHLTYLAKLAVLLERQDPAGRLTPHQIFDFTSSAFGSHPWDRESVPVSAAASLAALWRAFSAQIAAASPDTAFYAEKAPHWLPAVARESMPALTIYLFRDPRDIFLSANAFMQRRGAVGFDRLPQDTDLDYARTLAHRFLAYFENYRADGHRDDCVAVKYEDAMRSPHDLADLLAQKFGITGLTEETTWLASHSTAANLQASAGRWQREPLAPEVRGFLCRHLGAAMNTLGYPIDPPAEAPPPAVEFRLGGAALARMPSAGGRLILCADHAQAIVESGDFWLVPPLPPFDATEYQEVWACLRGTAGDVCSIYWRAAGDAFSEERSVHLPFWAGPHWQILRFPVANHPLWQGPLAELRFDPFNWKQGAPEVPQTGSLRWLRLIG